MDLEYDRKFEEMKKYIPFLESMIKRLENTSSASNPRQAQLDKIRSLRDLLMDKKKRMKMENLLKCEQVLVNLYEKVEQRDASPGSKKNIIPSQNSKPDLNAARNKLKSAVSKIKIENVETLPEIARASQTEEVCVPGSKEPALFQRRPNKSSKSPICSPQNKVKESSPNMHKRNYTRVLLSPEPNQKSWSTDDNTTDKPLFSRRSPKKSPRRRSPSHHKKERKKSSKNKFKQHSSKDLNITLNVPEESLNSLNTKDILSRIINCSDKDVDIDTLRELRSQILGELKETGANEDISDLILKSYKKKSKTNLKTTEVEEGELSDSESEAIESIYGSLVVVDKEKVPASASNKQTGEESRKIQICLVINSDQIKENSGSEIKNRIIPVDISDFESVMGDVQKNNDVDLSEKNTDEKSKPGAENTIVAMVDKKDEPEQQDKSLEHSNKNEEDSKLSVKNEEENTLDKSKQTNCVESNEENKPNFSTPITKRDEDIKTHTLEEPSQTIFPNTSNEEIDTKNSHIESTDKSEVQIPLLEPTKNVSEIDILQALKKEILSETDNVLSADADTPLLHQPKITKVINANEVGTKKRISIEKYKAKTNTSLTTMLDNDISSNITKDDSKKQSLKLTEKECERFNFPPKLILGAISDEEDEDKSNLSLDDIYGDLAPKSPDHEDFADMGIKPPVIIPSDPVRAPVVSSKADIDMRKILPLLSSSDKDIGNLSPAFKEKTSQSLPTQKEIISSDKLTTPLHDPRMKRDMKSTVKTESPNPYICNVDKTSINFPNTSPASVQNVSSSLSLNVNALNRNIMLSPSLPSNMTANINIPNIPNLVPNMTPIRTPNVPNMTPIPRFDMTPSRQITDNDDFGNSKHVYAPVFPIDNRDPSEKSRDNKLQPWDNAEKNNMPFWEDADYRDRDNRTQFERFQNGHWNDRFSYDVDHRGDCPPTPNHSFGRLECPATPTSAFGRMEVPLTPIHPFGRSECPSTPSHPFGRSECPSTPSHPFGRSECPSTPSHPFGRPEPLLPLPFSRSDYSQLVQNQSFGKSQDPRLNRNSDYDIYHNRDDERERGFYQDNKFNSNSYRPDRNNRNNNSEYHRRYQREQSVGRNERNRNYENNKNYEDGGRSYRDSYREMSVGRYNRDYDKYTRDRNASNKTYDHRNQNESRNYDREEYDCDRRFQRERSVGRTSSHSSTRDTSASRTISAENKLSVQRHGGHLFTIDSSITNSFQDISNRKNIISSFDARRQRAASVGRTLGRDFSPIKLHENESKPSLKTNVEPNNKRLDFRRASSVGRDIHASYLNFKEIKEDLKSFRLKGESRWNKEEKVKENTSKQGSSGRIKSCDPRSRKDIHEYNVKTNLGKNKYSPKKNIRDPRMRRENTNDKGDNYRSKSKDSKSYGIVYSNDNISKGTILGPGYGVKNYKIPKLKRPQETVENKEESDVKTKNISEYEEVKNVNKNNLDKKSTGQKEGNLSKNKVSGSKSSKETKLETSNIKKSKVVKNESDSSDTVGTPSINKSKVAKKESDASKSTTANKTNILNVNKIKDSNTTKNNYSDNEQDEKNDMTIDSIECSEKRITRSLSRRISKESSTELSPVKRTRRGKKPLVYETDSDDNDKKNEKVTKANTSLKCEDKNMKPEMLNDDFKEVNNKANKNRTTETEDRDVLGEFIQNSNDDKTSCNLGTNFGIDDLEIFSDNIVSDPVIKNINDLIADLDHDLDSTKNVDTNNFTRELSLDRMLENITSPESETMRDLPVEPPASPERKTTRDLLADSSMNENIETIKEETKNNNNSKLISSEEAEEINLEETNKNTTMNINTNSTESDLEKQNNLPHELINQNAENKINKNTSMGENRNRTENPTSEDTCSNDAIVTTSEDREKEKNERDLITGPDDTKVKPQSTPDSTINNNVTNVVESQRNLPDSTNDLSCEMNSVISSTNVDSVAKDNAEPTSSHTPASNEIESIGKLLSILQDKTKIKELLGLLSDHSSENDKIKKKLEKLSEIVSDDEESSQTENNKEKLNEQKTDESETLITDLKHEDNKEEFNSGNTTEKFYCNSVLSKNERDTDQVNSSSNCIEKETLSKIEETCTDNLNVSIPTASDIDNSDKVNVNTTQDEEKKKNNDLESCTSKETNINKKNAKKVLTKRGRKKNANKAPAEEKRLTRSDAANLRIDKPVVKKPSRELQKLQDDIREMFIRDDILSATGLRMCRLAKFVDETKPQKDESQNNENRHQEPVVVLQNINDSNATEENNTAEKNIKKKVIQRKNKVLGPRKLGKDLITKIKAQKADGTDPYAFETDSLNETINSSNDNNINSESESDSLASSKSFGSIEQLEEIKKKKRKRSKGWQAGVIKLKTKKKKVESKTTTILSNNDSVEIRKSIEIPDLNCYTDKTYCFDKNRSIYDCRLCSYSGTDIVYHYKQQHPHSEIPLSRMNAAIAMEAITESEKINFQVISKLPSKRYICRFCSKEFGRKKPVLESFFWHVVSMHTGEYKQLCSECLNVTRCPFSLDIPPPPKDKGQLLGYVCEKCNYTQISLENLKSHVILRHNDEQTAVCTINLSVTTKSIMNNTVTESEELQNTDIDNLQPRVLRSSRSNQSIEESSDVRRDSTEDFSRNLKIQNFKSKDQESILDHQNVIKTCKIKSKITFENDNTDELLDYEKSAAIKVEPGINEHQDDVNYENSGFDPEQETEEFNTHDSEETGHLNASSDIFNYPHFKIKYSESGSKEYICCINGKDLHYRTTLLISFKKHVQLKHSENWDGYCFICKVIVTPQGTHLFKDCLQHFLNQHMDDFPILEDTTNQVPQLSLESDVSNDSSFPALETPKSYINVRPLSQLLLQPNTSQIHDESVPTLPVIESVVSLGAAAEQPSRSSPIVTAVASEVVTEVPEVVRENKYEEAQAEVMSRKHRVVLGAMMSHVKLVQVFKCAGRFCSFTTDVAEDALIHASTHTEIGGENSLSCVYCDFDSSGNAIDLITHVFKDHGCCQYVCGHCFYRAAASQLVNAHHTRVHGNSAKSIILHTDFQTASTKEDNIMSREAAVPFYLCCASSGSGDTCKFRTYTPGKFCEHLQLKHSSVTEHSCFLCSDSLKTPADLIRHLKTHGLKLYQCTWCVFGADNETELLAHASAKHPDKQPKAYLRIITNKEGTSEFRVLPLAHLNKSDMPVIEVTANKVKDHPTREAKRSIDLEKLIGQTTLMAESMTATPETKTVEQDSAISQVIEPINEAGLEISSLLETSSEQMRQDMVTPPPHANNVNLIANQLTPVIKSELVETPEKGPLNDSDVVLCLDSDEEDSRQNVIDLSEDQGPPINADKTEPKLLPLTKLFLCAKCNAILKNGVGFRGHITSCFKNVPDPIPCAHCSIKFKRRHILSHYNKTHAEKSKPFACTQCPGKFETLPGLKEHSKTHPCIQDNLILDQPVTSTMKPGPANRRKRSLGAKDKAMEPPEKMKRFGPQDVNLLPINPILDESVFCSLCEFSTKVRLNMVRHLQLHAEQQPVPQTAPVNPVPYLETNEKHFDKMVNLASSSLVPKVSDKNKADSSTGTSLTIPPEAVSRYPKYVPEKHRHTCGAIGCSYISVDESMLKCHWETLHSGTNDFRCVHCPPHQQLDTSRPLTASRIIAHLKMHDATLYACSLCSYYHYKRNILENHLADVHKGGQVMIVREEGSNPALSVVTNQAPINTPTMDLKPWQCGLCKFKSLLRPEVIEHCAKLHNSKMQYKCAYCAFRTSNSENITKHQSKSHSDRREEIFYYYYREGSVPDDPDGTPLWQKQSQKCDVSEPTIKSESPCEASSSPQLSLPITKPPIHEVDLNLVKKEVSEPVEDTVETLCAEFGDFCEPNGLKYKCSLCKNVVEDTLEAMQSHLYEELKYRKWGCGICSYKAFHKTGLSVHMQTEHRQNKKPIALQIDNRVETWVAKLLEHQTDLIIKNKENLAKQKEEILRPVPGVSRPKSPPKKKTETNQSCQPGPSSSSKPTMVELERLFGSLGASVSMSFCCPKCHSIIKDENIMQNHLENELNKIRWLCSNCPVTFQNYHEAQFHCRSVHIGQSARPMEATRDPSIRSAWVEAVIHIQKLSMNYVPLPSKTFAKDMETNESENSAPDNSLLVVRYEERVPTPEEQMARITPIVTVDCDEDKPEDSNQTKSKEMKMGSCPHCEYKSINARTVRDHVLRHYNLRPTSCGYCGLSGSKKSVELHHRNAHPNQAVKLISTPIPEESPADFLRKQSNTLPDVTKVICLVCQNAFTDAEAATHSHEKVPTSFGKKGDVVVKCSLCFSLYKDVNSYFNHHKSFHATLPVNYVFSKLNTISNESKSMLYACSQCSLKFSQLKDIKLHSDSIHGTLKYKIVPKISEQPGVIELDSDCETGTKRRNDTSLSSPIKKVAKKSTTKLPFNKPIARKSTTKLPLNVPEGFSYYGTKPSTEGLDNVTALMAFGNTMVPFTLKKLNDIIKINPIVLIDKLKE